MINGVRFSPAVNFGHGDTTARRVPSDTPPCDDGCDCPSPSPVGPDEYVPHAPSDRPDKPPSPAYPPPTAPAPSGAPGIQKINFNA